MRDAVGKYEKGVFTILESGLYRYDVRCEDCGSILGTLDFTSERPNHDPADSGLICGDCAAARRSVKEEK